MLNYRYALKKANFTCILITNVNNLCYFRNFASKLKLSSLKLRKNLYNIYKKTYEKEGNLYFSKILYQHIYII